MNCSRITTVGGRFTPIFCMMSNVYIIVSRFIYHNSNPSMYLLVDQPHMSSCEFIFGQSTTFILESTKSCIYIYMFRYCFWLTHESPLSISWGAEGRLPWQCCRAACRPAGQRTAAVSSSGGMSSRPAGGGAPFVPSRPDGDRHGDPAAAGSYRGTGRPPARPWSQERSGARETLLRLMRSLRGRLEHIAVGIATTTVYTISYSYRL